MFIVRPLFFWRALFLAACALSWNTAVAESAPPVRSERSLDPQWHFRYGEITATLPAEAEMESWPTVDLPHTWNAADGADGGGNYARGTGWYSRHFKVDAAWAGRQIFIQFEGANRTTTVFLNGQRIGEHTGGFARFRFDLTDAIKRDAENFLVVKVNNADNGTAPISADFTFFGGLYRSVKLFATAPVHVDAMDHASSGIYLTQKNVSAARADLSATVRVRNDSDRTQRALVRTVVRDARGTVVATKEETCEIAAKENAVSVQELVVATPQLWNGRKNPSLYSAEVSISQQGKIIDHVSESIGLRSFAVDAEKGFFLNGQHLDLHGVCRQQDRLGKGWAISADDDREDFALIQEIGATAIRVAHYPQSQLWFDLADRTGMVLWAEIPVVNEVPATATYVDNAKEQLRELIRQNYNRPSICFWGVGNETREVGESSGHEQPNPPNADRLIAELAALAKTEDPTRLSTYASHHRAEDIRNFHTDVLGFNKYFGWYSANSAGFAPWVDEVHKRFPTLRFSMSEFGAGANILQHDQTGVKPTPGGAWHPEEYQALAHEAHWLAMRTRDYLWGKFIWNMFDFAADQRSEGGAPGINDKGLVTYDRKTKKDAFFWYKANWSDVPVLYIAGRRFAERPVGKTEVKVYATSGQAELFINGKSCGALSSDTHIFRWEVELAAGENRVTARAKSPGGELSDACILTGSAKVKL